MEEQSVRKSLRDLQRVMPSSLKSIRKMIVDLVLVLDVSESMQNIMDSVREISLAMPEFLKEALTTESCRVMQLRVKVIAFRDVYSDAGNAFEESRFFVLTDGDAEETEFRCLVESLKAEGGRSGQKSALEALHRAIKTDFAEPHQGQKARHIIMLITDSPEHLPDCPERSSCAGYPQGVPADLVGLEVEWMEKMDERSRRLVLFTPNDEPWKTVSCWHDARHATVAAVTGDFRQELPWLL